MSNMHRNLIHLSLVLGPLLVVLLACGHVALQFMTQQYTLRCYFDKSRGGFRDAWTIRTARSCHRALGPADPRAVAYLRVSRGSS